MTDIPGHALPRYSESARDDALFHYTTADGLLGILEHNEIWSTAYYCANDESELLAGKNILTPFFRSKTVDLLKGRDARIKTLINLGTNLFENADRYEQTLISHMLSALCVYITCFCKPTNEESFLHGLLSQWRGYGIDGGYAIQFSRKKLEERIKYINKDGMFDYELKDVYYSSDNPLKEEVISHKESFIKSYEHHLEMISEFIANKTKQWSPLENLHGGPLESFLDYLIQTKNVHFSEENECRMSVLGPTSNSAGNLKVHYINRNGHIVPYTKTPQDFNILDCIEWIVIGPSQRIANRFTSVTQMIRKMGLNIQVRPSHIPLSRA